MLPLNSPRRLELRSSPTHPWRWEENGRVLVWEDGTTLSFIHEIEAMAGLTVQGRLPALPYVALLLAGCRGKAPIYDLLDTDEYPLTELIRGSEAFRKLRLLPAEVLTPRGKATLIEMAAEAVHAPMYDVAEAIEDWRQETTFVRHSGEVDSLFSLVIRLTPFLNQVTASAILARMRTGLEVVPEKAELPEFEVSHSIHDLLKKLREHPQGHGIAAMARDVMAALTFPRRPEEDDAHQEGGFSDLTNRGTPDRLLLSELAADPLLLAVRVSMNEALYLRRETPRKSRKRAVAILVDTGLLLWGLPRPISWAVALALLAKQEKQARLAVWQVAGKKIQAVPLRSTEDLLKALEKLDPGVDPVPALQCFFDQAKTWSEDSPDPAETDFVFITHPDTLEHPDFWREANHWPTLHLALVDQQGRFTFEQRSRSTRRELAEAQLNLEKLLTPEVAKTAQTGPREPLMLGIKPFPMLIDVRGKVIASCPAGKGAWCAIVDFGQWVYWKATMSGCQLLTCQLPKGRIVWTDYATESNTAYAVFSDDVKITTTLLKHANDEVAEYPLNVDSASVHAHRFGDVLVIIGRKSLYAFSLDTGRLISELSASLKHAHLKFHGRFCHDRSGTWYILTWNGEKPSLELLSWPDEKEIVLAFENQNGDPHALYKNGRLMSFVTEPPSQIFLLATIKEISPDSVSMSCDGSRLFINVPEKMSHAWDFSERKWRPMYCSMKDSWLKVANPPTSSFFINVTRIGFTRDYSLAVQLNGRKWHKLTGSHSNQMRWTENVPAENITGIVLVKEVQSQTKLWGGMAEWSNGDCILVNRQGLLHLMPASNEQPELCVSTSSGFVRFWSSESSQNPPIEKINMIRRFAQETLRNHLS